MVTVTVPGAQVPASSALCWILHVAAADGAQLQTIGVGTPFFQVRVEVGSPQKVTALAVTDGGREDITLLPSQGLCEGNNRMIWDFKGKLKVLYKPLL